VKFKTRAMEKILHELASDFFIAALPQFHPGSALHRTNWQRVIRTRNEILD
jgi:hypothetical protein